MKSHILGRSQLLIWAALVAVLGFLAPLPGGSLPPAQLSRGELDARLGGQCNNMKCKEVTCDATNCDYTTNCEYYKEAEVDVCRKRVLRDYNRCDSNQGVGQNCTDSSNSRCVEYYDGVYSFFYGCTLGCGDPHGFCGPFHYSCTHMGCPGT